jgi:uncharacterized membrane protein
LLKKLSDCTVVLFLVCKGLSGIVSVMFHKQERRVLQQEGMYLYNVQRVQLLQSGDHAIGWYFLIGSVLIRNCINTFVMRQKPFCL